MHVCKNKALCYEGEHETLPSCIMSKCTTDTATCTAVPVQRAPLSSHSEFVKPSQIYKAPSERGAYRCRLC